MSRTLPGPEPAPDAEPPDGPPDGERPPERGGWPGRWAGVRRALPALGSLQGGVGLVLVLVIGIVTKGDTFLNETNLTNAVGAFSSRGILAVGVTLVILTAGIDLSVGSLMGFCSMAAALLLVNEQLPVWQIVPLCMLAGAAFGLVNGVGTAWLRIQSFVMTLAMLSIARGLDRQMSDNVSVGTQVSGPDGQLTPESESFQSLGTPGHNVLEGTWLPLVGREGVYFPVLAFVAVCVVFHLLLTRTRFGRHVYAVGGNPTAARLSGVNVTFVVIAVFTLSGMLAGTAGPIDAAYSASADPLAGTSYELDAIAAAVIGGASLAGGKGTIAGTFVGALILTLLDNVLGLNAVSDNWQLVIKGSIVVVAVVLQRPDLLRRREKQA
ncbi:ABC transporter permease [Streptomyces sp. AJS327]|uniref:ABC transporter permease n=1 Tax=Streptomyces sp. AJS327 TaxID=2545265 RepID=UPI0015E03CB5|nr:ABC transporter permease [Streptomyces sp. AJS327]MBA0052575.1 ABC transporter permease [Streptomyces sp. AJS327]